MKPSLVMILIILLPSKALSMDKLAQTDCKLVFKYALNNSANLSHKIPRQGTRFEGVCDIRYSANDAKNWFLKKNSVLILYEDGWLDKETGHFLYLHKDQQGTFTAFWNGGGYSSHAHTALNYEPFEQMTLGKLQCWESEVAQICFSEKQLNNE